jgi:hypothetical protein
LTGIALSNVVPDDLYQDIIRLGGKKVEYSKPQK